MATTLAFRTPIGGVSIPAGTSQELGRVDVSRFNEVRLVADERVGSPSGGKVRLTITEGQELVADLGVLTLSPESEKSRTFGVPASTLTVFVDAAPGASSDALDVLLYGSD